MTGATITGPVDRDRLEADEGYRLSLVEQVIHRVGTAADHTDITRDIRRNLPGSDSLAVGALAGHVRAELDSRRTPPPAGDPIDVPVHRRPGVSLTLPDPRGRDLVEYCAAVLRADFAAAGGEVLAHLKQHDLWNHGRSDQAFYVGPWRKAKGQVRKERGDTRRTAPAAAAAGASAPPPAADDCIVFRSGRGEFRAEPRDGRWHVTLSLDVDRTTALSLQGQAFALLYPAKEA